MLHVLQAEADKAVHHLKVLSRPDAHTFMASIAAPTAWSTMEGSSVGPSMSKGMLVGGFAGSWEVLAATAGDASPRKGSSRKGECLPAEESRPIRV